ncbi:MAG: hypothetical protein KDK12_17675 [Rhodobacteraceae bacterium]|nr:hypothetical protein [Paracoccaceae bacterium]
MGLTKRIALRMRLRVLSLGVAAGLTILPGDAPAQSGSAWRAYEDRDGSNVACILEGQFSSATANGYVGRMVRLASWSDGSTDWDDDVIGVTVRSDTRLRSDGGNRSRVSVFFPLGGRSRTYRVEFHAQDRELEVLNGSLFDELVAEAGRPGGENGVVHVLFANGDPFGRLPLRGFQAAVTRYRSCLDF